MNAGLLCPVCGTPAADPGSLAEHLVTRAGTSDAGHIMWMNRNVTKLALPVAGSGPHPEPGVTRRDQTPRAALSKRV